MNNLESESLPYTADSYRRFLVYVAKSCKIDKQEDWYRLTAEQVNHCGGSGLLQHYTFSVPRIITSNFPGKQFST